MRTNEAVDSFNAAALRRVRDERGLSQAELAAEVGARPAQISGYERGERVPGIETFVALARVLEVDPFTLAGVDASTATLADHRARCGVSKAALAAKVGLTEKAWAQIESGRQQDVLERDLAERVGEVLGLDAEAVRAARERGRARRAARRLRSSPVSRARYELAETAERLAVHAERFKDELSPSALSAVSASILALRALASQRSSEPRPERTQG